ncbi:MAG TPA: endonuclease/exonuclease/phosphatase family protein [Rhodocyclaceae bacterium]|jgi:endonuclease/exonuclease/phosphatase family metal-dependent hydrolase
MTFRLTTWNIHKGFSPLNRRLTVHALRDSLRTLAPDLIFLQEVQGLHLDHGKRHGDWPVLPQHEFLAEDHWQATYGHNVSYDQGHHGNAILSRYPVLHSHNQDVTHLSFERRGMLHTTVEVPGLPLPLHCVCAHLSLFAGSRRFQLDALVEQLDTLVPKEAPLVIAGDFNDWRNHADTLLARRMGLTEAFSSEGKPARSFPALLPMMRLDRIYLRGLKVLEREVHRNAPWSRISDHAPLSVVLAAA